MICLVLPIGVCDLSDTEIDVSSFVKIDYSLFPTCWLMILFPCWIRVVFILLTSGIESDKRKLRGCFMGAIEAENYRMALLCC